MTAKTDTDDDLLTLSRDDLLAETLRLRSGIRDHRDQRGDDRCWLDDDKLYQLLPEKLPAPTAMDAELMLPNCKRFLATRVNPRDRFAWGDTPGGGMLAILAQAERELPSLLLSEEDWQSLFVDDEKPNVERVWMPYGEGRLYLHVIHPCAQGEPLVHPHPWPAGMRVHAGSYETAYGHGPPEGPVPAMGTPKVVLSGGTYEMVNPEAWHYVRPIGGPATTVMVTGKPWTTGHRKARDLGPLSPERKRAIIAQFRTYYPLAPH
jgi:hypothetical protein